MGVARSGLWSPDWWRKICQLSGQEFWLVDVVVIHLYCFAIVYERPTKDTATEVWRKRDQIYYKTANICGIYFSLVMLCWSQRFLLKFVFAKEQSSEIPSLPFHIQWNLYCGTQLRGRRGVGHSTNFYMGRLRPEVQPITPQLYTIFRIPSIDKWCPFYIPRLELCIPFKCCKCIVASVRPLG